MLQTFTPIKLILFVLHVASFQDPKKFNRSWHAEVDPVDPFSTKFLQIQTDASHTQLQVSTLFE